MILKTLFSQLLTRPATNRFPAKYMPKSVLGFLGKVKEGKAQLVPPVPIPPRFRGRSPMIGRSASAASSASGSAQRR